MKENVIEWYDDRAALTLTDTSWKNRILKLSERYPDLVEIVSQNPDGSWFVHIPASWIKIYPPREYSEEQREKMRVHGYEIYEKYLKPFQQRKYNM